ncbi:MAG: hypothetical protein PF447_15010 [Spirochaetaceae bacterium]|jgi:hypothetical protein|nr:hypothetical protein [Spirochaetaceae bacterium]
MRYIGEILVENNLLSKSDLDKALEIQSEQTKRQHIGEILISMGLITVDVLMKYLDVQFQANNVKSGKIS